jgi:hypothetical protein
MMAFIFWLIFEDDFAARRAKAVSAGRSAGRASGGSAKTTV